MLHVPIECIPLEYSSALIILRILYTKSHSMHTNNIKSVLHQIFIKRRSVQTSFRVRAIDSFHFNLFSSFAFLFTIFFIFLFVFYFFTVVFIFFRNSLLPSTSRSLAGQALFLSAGTGTTSWSYKTIPEDFIVSTTPCSVRTY